jgi:acyl carrier protein
MDIRQRIRDFITANFYVADPSALADDASLLDQGIIDSTGVLEIIMFLEDNFGFKVADAEMVPDNLDSISSIASFVDRKRS